MTLQVALVGDQSPEVTAHRAIPLALGGAAATLDLPIRWSWISTESLEPGPEPLGDAGAIWLVPGSPYRSEAGAIRAVRHARENGIPFLGTCGGFQHAVLELARNVLGRADAAHAETHPDADFCAVTRLACSLVEADGSVTLEPGSALQRCYGRGEIPIRYHCRFGLAPGLEDALAGHGVRVTARDPEGEIRALELGGHPFFVATLFQPERDALVGGRVPPAEGLLAAAVVASESRR